MPGLNTTIEGRRPTATARRFVAATRGDVAMITYLGGPFPRAATWLAALVDAVDPSYAMKMAPRLVAFSEDVDRSVTPHSQVPVTSSAIPTAGRSGHRREAGLTADRTLYLAAAGAGAGIDDPGDWHNRNPRSCASR